MANNEDIWTYWGPYTNDAAVKSAVNTDEIVLDTTGRRMFCVHPISVMYLAHLNMDERRMIRQHLDYLLQDGVETDFEHAVSESVTNLNTVGNRRRSSIVRFNNEVEFNDGSRSPAQFQGDRSDEGFRDDRGPPPPSGVGSRLGNVRPPRPDPIQVPYGSAPGSAQEYYNDAVPVFDDAGFDPAPAPSSIRRNSG